MVNKSILRLLMLTFSVALVGCGADGTSNEKSVIVTGYLACESNDKECPDAAQCTNADGVKKCVDVSSKIIH